MAQVKYPIGIQDFEKLIQGGYLYVDKTAYIRQLVDRGASYFMSRPRRFGKSLVLSTLEKFFEGRRDLFSGLAINEWEEWDWEPYPVIRIDFNAKDYTYKESLFEKIDTQLIAYEKKYDVSSTDMSLDGRFSSLIRRACEVTGKRVVVLIDEYDKPILDTMHDERTKNLHRDQLRAFYATLKSSDEYLQFCFLTGVTKIGQMNIFSGLNNLNDISIDDQYAGFCGITEAELHHYFQDGVERCAGKWNCTVNEAFSLLKKNYDGYHFSPSLLDVYNPWSVLNAVSKEFIDSYWHQTGGGLTFLYKTLKHGDLEISDLDNTEAEASELKGPTTDLTSPVTILYQSGYLTIKSYNPQDNLFTLKYPNLEVERGFLKGILPYYSGVNDTKLCQASFSNESDG